MKNIALPVQTSNFTKQAFMTDVFGCNLFTEDLWMVDDCFSTHSAYFPTFGVRKAAPHIYYFLNINYFLIIFYSLNPHLTFSTRSISEGLLKLKLFLNFCLHISFQCLKWFYEGLHKTFPGTTRKGENKNLREGLILR